MPSTLGYKCTALLVDKSTPYNCTVKSINLYRPLWPLKLPLTLSSTTCPCVNLVSTATEVASCVHPTWTLKPSLNGASDGAEWWAESGNERSKKEGGRRNDGTPASWLTSAWVTQSGTYEEKYMEGAENSTNLCIHCCSEKGCKCIHDYIKHRMFIKCVDMNHLCPRNMNNLQLRSSFYLFMHPKAKVHSVQIFSRRVMWFFLFFEMNQATSVWLLNLAAAVMTQSSLGNNSCI